MAGTCVCGSANNAPPCDGTVLPSPVAIRLVPRMPTVVTQPSALPDNVALTLMLVERFPTPSVAVLARLVRWTRMA